MSLDEIARQFRRRRRFNPLLIPWRWRWEGALGTGLTLGSAELAEAVHPAAPVSLLATAALAHLGSAPVRRFTSQQFWRIVIQHRLRVGFVQAGVYNWSGRIPAILWTSARPKGVRVYLWCPAGVDVNMLKRARSVLAAACWAADVRVWRHRRHANMVVLFVVTRSGAPENGNDEQ